MKLKLNYFLLFTVLSLNTIYAQDLYNLDRKFGFNKFKLESSFNLYEKQLRYLFSGSDKVKYYEYKGKDIPFIFGCFVKKINLGFYKEKIYTISIIYITTGDKDEKNIQKGLQELFGYMPIEYNAETSDLKYDWVILWKTNKTHLQTGKISCDNSYYACEVETFLFSRKLRNEINNERF